MTTTDGYLTSRDGNCPLLVKKVKGSPIRNVGTGVDPGLEPRS